MTAPAIPPNVLQFVAENIDTVPELETLLLLLLRAYLKVRQRLLLWSGLCFAGLTLSNR